MIDKIIRSFVYQIDTQNVDQRFLILQKRSTLDTVRCCEIERLIFLAQKTGGYRKFKNVFDAGGGYHIVLGHTNTTSAS